MQHTETTDQRTALLLGLDSGAYDAERSMEELAALCEAAGLVPGLEVLQKRAAPDRATVLGHGRLEEARRLAEANEADLAVFDGELTGSQLKNLERALGLPVIDRTMLILEIFASRAVSREGKTQTELATLEYRLPRLAGHGTSLSRQAGGGGGGGGARRGGGETKLEYDRRYIRTRIAILKRRLREMRARRDENRRARDKSGVPVIALVGYTNVGKSSLLNALCEADVPAQDMLFATLDPTARRLELPDGQHCVMVDTVGFVSRLPHNLVAAFKSTLEEVRFADLLIKVADAADPEAGGQLHVTDEVLATLGVGESPQLVVYNKCDLAPGFTPPGGALCVSAHTGQNLDALKAAICEHLQGRVQRIRVLLPHQKLALANTLRRHGSVASEEWREDGLLLTGSIEAGKAHLFAPYLLLGEAAE